MNDHKEHPTTESTTHSSIEGTLARHGRKLSKRRRGVGLPVAQTLVLRSYEARRISLEVLIDGEWADQIKMRLDDADDRISGAAVNAVDKQAAVLGELCFEALLHAIQAGAFDASVVIDTTGYEKP